MRDIDIRHSLVRMLRQVYRHEPDTLILEEMGLCQGAAIVDLAVINGFLHGYEIKSEQDKLDRLQVQEQIYNKTLDRVTLVTGERHVDKLLKTAPVWWGLWKASGSNAIIHIREVRRPGQNPSIDPMAVVQLLWRDEAIAALSHLGLHRGLANKPRAEAWRRLVESLPVDDLRRTVTERIKSRQGWR